MVNFPTTLAPSYFNIDQLPDYGMKIIEDETGTERRIFTESTGFNTKIRVKYTGMNSDEVQTLVAFYQAVKGTFGVFNLPPEFFPNPADYNLAIDALQDTTDWRFESAPMIDTILNDIYSTEFILISLKNEVELNVDKIFGFTRELSLSWKLPRLTFLAQDSQNTLDVEELVFSVPSVGIIDAEIIKPLILNFTPTLIQVSSERVISPAELIFNPGDASNSGEFTEMQKASLSFGIIGSEGIVPDIVPTNAATLVFSSSNAEGSIPDTQLALQVSLVYGSTSYTTTLVPSESLDDAPLLSFGVPSLSTSIVPLIEVNKATLSFGNALEYGQSGIISYPLKTANLIFSIFEVTDEPLDIASAISPSLNFSSSLASIFELETRFVTHEITFSVPQAEVILPDDAIITPAQMLYSILIANGLEADTAAIDKGLISFSPPDLFGADTGLSQTVDVVSVVPTPIVIEEYVAVVNSIAMNFGEFFVGFVFSQAGIGMTSQHRDSNFNAFANGVFIVNTSSNEVTTQLPTNPDHDSVIIFADCTGSIVSTSATGFGFNSLVINPGTGDTIQGATQLTLDVDNMGVQLMYDSSLNNWTIIGNSF